MRVLGLILLCFSFSALADRQLTTQIYDVDYGREPGDEILVFLANGHVAKLPKGQEAMLSRLTSLKSNQKLWYTFTLDDNRYIKQVKPSKEKGYSFDPARLPTTESFTSYVPTTIESM